MAYTILLIEDDKELANLVSRYLNHNGFAVMVVNSVAQFQSCYQQCQPDLILCDVMLPDGNGFELFPFLKKHFNCPIIFLTALDSEHSEIKGLNLGANDYLIKPIRPELLLARVNSRLRLCGKGEVRKSIGPIVLDTYQRQLSYQGQQLNLSDDEVSLCALFIQSHPTPLSREAVFREVIGREYDGLDRAADLKVSRLRRKLRDFGMIGVDIISIRGEGYRFQFMNDNNA